MVVLVTGGAGFVGRHVCNLLHSKGIDNIAIDNFDLLCGGDRNFPAHQIDILDLFQLDKFILAYGITDIIHLAAYARNLTCQDHVRAAWDVNVTGTRNVLEAARVNKLNRVVLCSSNIVLSDQPTVYKATKKAVELLGQTYAKLGVSNMALRPSNIYGIGQSRVEYQPCAFAGLDITYARIGRFQITGNGTQTRDWVHVDDVADAFLLALQNQTVVGATVDICTGQQTSMNEIADILGVSVDYIGARPGDAKSLVSSTRMAWQRLGFAAHRYLGTYIHEAFPSVKR